MTRPIGVDVLINLAGDIKKALTKQEGEVGDAAERMKKKLTISLALAGGGLVASKLKTASASIVQNMTETTRAVQVAAGELKSVGVENVQAVIAEGQKLQGKYVGMTSDAFVRAAYDIKSGISSLTDEGVAAMTSSALTVAKATRGVPEAMTSLFASAYGTFKKQFQEMSDADWGDMFGAALSKSVQQFKTDGAKMQQAIESAGSGATNLGMKMTEQMTLLGMMQQTMQAGEAGTALKAFATNAAKAHTAFGKMKVSADRPVRVRILDENGQMRAMPDIMTDLKERYGETLDAFEAAEIKDAFGTDEAMKLINALYGQEEAIRANGTALDEAAAQGAAFSEAMAASIDDRDGASWELMGQRLDVLKQKLGAGLLPALDAIAPKISSVVEWFSKFSSENPGLVAGLGATVVGLGAFATVAAPVLYTASAMVAGFGAIKTALTAMKVAMLTNPITLAIAALAAGAYLIYQNWDGIKAFFSDLWGSIKAKTSAAWDGIKAGFMKYHPAGIIYQNWDGISAWFGEKFDQVKATFAAKWAAIKATTANAWDGIKAGFMDYHPAGIIYQNWDGISAWFGQKFDQVKTTFTTKWTAIKATFSGWKNDLRQVGVNIVQGLLNGIQAKWDALKAKIREMADMLPAWLKKRLGIQSPSRVFMGLGTNIGEGLAIGIGGQKENVVNHMDSIRKAIVAPMAAGAVLGAGGASAAGLLGAGMTAPDAGVFAEAGAQLATTAGTRSLSFAPTYHIDMSGGAVGDQIEALREMLDERDREAQQDMERMLND